MEQWNRRRRNTRIAYSSAVFIVGALFSWWWLTPENLPAPSAKAPPSLAQSEPNTPKAKARIAKQSDSNEPNCEPIPCAMDRLDEARVNGFRCPDGQVFEPGQPLDWDDDLEDIAAGQAEFLARVGYLDHDTPESPLGLTLSERLAGVQDVERSGEVLYRGSGRGEAAMNWWLQSPQHCSHLMDPAMGGLGLEFAEGEEGFVWVGIVAN